MVIIVDQFNMPDNVYEVIFTTKQQAIVAKTLIDKMKENNGVFEKTDMSIFANALHEGAILTETKDEKFKDMKIRLSYNKKQFYERILTPLKSMGIVEYDLYNKVYKVSDRFNKLMIKISIMWSQEFRRGT